MTNIKNLFTQTAKFIIILSTFGGLLACEKLSESKVTYSKTRVAALKTANKKSNAPTHLWGRLRNNFHIPKEKEVSNHHHVKKYVQHYRQQEKNIQAISTQASPYLFYIVEQLEQRNMPGELALLPMIESAFRPQATSNRGAAGLWQFIPGTGRYFGLKQDAWYDGRKDVKASTKAALDYLEYLHKEFDNNWMLALAAYNAGEGTIQKAIKRNQREGKPTNFWSLELPKETREYVPKFLALAQVMENPEKHDIALPTIENRAYFSPVNPGKPLTFKQVAKLADLNISEVIKLNPGYRKFGTHPKGPQELLLPIENIPKFEYNLSRKH
jgi:membrane-bound lytic murein transglycosylase D